MLNEHTETCIKCRRVLSDTDYFEDALTRPYVVRDGDADPQVTEGPYCIRCFRKEVGLDQAAMEHCLSRGGHCWVREKIVLTSGSEHLWAADYPKYCKHCPATRTVAGLPFRPDERIDLGVIRRPKDNERRVVVVIGESWSITGREGRVYNTTMADPPWEVNEIVLIKDSYYKITGIETFGGFRSKDVGQPIGLLVVGVVNRDGLPYPTTAETIAATDSAADLQHPQRAMCVTLECGHLRLMPKVNTITGVGSQTACKVCSTTPGPDGVMPPQVARTVVKIEETGALMDNWYHFGRR